MPVCTVNGCGEPWDLDSIHDHISDVNPDKPWRRSSGATDQGFYESHFWEPALREFRETGCAMFGCRHNIPETVDVDSVYGLTASQAQDALWDLLGDDVDGIEAEMQDLGFV